MKGEDLGVSFGRTTCLTSVGSVSVDGVEVPGVTGGLGVKDKEKRN